VQVPNKAQTWLPLYSLYALGVLVSSVTLGGILGFIGSQVVPHQWQSQIIALIAILGIGLACCDFGIGGARTLTLWRQTCPVWWRTLGQHRAVFLWGLDLGLGFTTIRVASLYWIVFLMVILIASPLLGAAILGGYGLGLILNLSAGVFLLAPKEENLVTINRRALQYWYPLKIGLAVVLLLWSTLLLSGIL
jgi:hypothetical protein